ncbi:MAG: ABC transporter ATP-binding protein [Elusimicrobiota bacterium]|jgi:ABC-2 type transport system ATP-binding protein|nr:ABC transporter ATP-binding protein [Elusimicrobiota bacterium]
MTAAEAAAAQANENIIEVKDLTVSFGDFKAVDGISFDVKKGEIFGFLGANGAGKTTTIRTLCGILNPARGSVRVDGRDVSSSTAVLKPLIGYMSQKFTLYRDLSIAENMAFAGSLYDMPPARAKARAAELFDFIKLRAPQDTVAGDLPGGVRQMVALCAALLHDPVLIFLDEPTAGAAPRTREDFWALIRALAARGKTIFVTTHYMDEAQYCAHIALMDRGRIIALASPRELKKTYNAQNLDEVFIKALGARGAEDER